MGTQTIRAAVSGCDREAVSDIVALLELNGRHVESQALRDAGDRLDGIRYALNVLADERLLDAAVVEEWREALRVLRLTEQTAGYALSRGFATGVHMVRDKVARLVESASS